MKRHHEIIRKKIITYAVSRQHSPEALKRWAEVYTRNLEAGVDVLIAGQRASQELVKERAQ